MRDLVKVIDQMKEVLPASEDRLFRQLDSLQQSALYTSPETIGFRWRAVAECLTDRFCPVVDGIPQDPTFEPNSWEQKLSDIWMDK